MRLCFYKHLQDIATWAGESINRGLCSGMADQHLKHFSGPEGTDATSTFVDPLRKSERLVARFAAKVTHIVMLYRVRRRGVKLTVRGVADVGGCAAQHSWWEFLPTMTRAHHS